MAIQNNILLKQKTKAPNISNITTNRVSTSQHEVNFDISKGCNPNLWQRMTVTGIIDHNFQLDAYFEYNL